MAKRYGIPGIRRQPCRTESVPLTSTVISLHWIRAFCDIEYLGREQRKVPILHLLQGRRVIQHRGIRCMTRATQPRHQKDQSWICFSTVEYIRDQQCIPFSSSFPIPFHRHPTFSPLLPALFSSLFPAQAVSVAADTPTMCIQTIGICPYSHREHLGLHWCSLLISRGQWNLFDCSAFEALEIDSPQWSCQTCLEQSAGRKTYLDTSFRLDLWRSFFRRLRPRKPRARRCTAWEMQLV